MSLATRCTQCGTIFKVVQDQLKVSEGWVRCGRCHEVFNALEGLFDLERDPPPARRRPTSAAPPAREPQGGAVAGAQAGTSVAAPSWENTSPLSFGDEPAATSPSTRHPSAPAPMPSAAPAPVAEPPTAPDALAPGSPAVDDLPAFLLKPRIATAAAAVAAAPLEDEPVAFTALPSGDPEPHTVSPPGPAPAAAAPTAPAAAPARHPLAPPVAAELPSTHEDDALDSRWLMSPTRDERAASERLNREAHTDDFADAQFPQDVNEDLAAEDWSEAAAPAPLPAVAAPTKDGGSKRKRSARKGKRPLPADAPDFVKRAERRAQWRHPAVRATLGLVAAALLGLLLLQGGYHFKDLLAARWPQIRPVLEAACRPAGCEVGAPLQDDALAVESHKLSRPSAAAAASDAAGAEVYRLSLVLHNKADYAVAPPHVELTLKDANDVLLSRRTLSLSELGYTGQALPASGNVELQVLFASASPVSGYDVGIFYP